MYHNSSSRADRKVKRHVPVSVDCNFFSHGHCLFVTQALCSLALSLPKVRFEEVSCFAHVVFPCFPSPFLCSCHAWLRLSKRLSPSAPLLLRLARKRPVTSKSPPAPMRERTFLWSW